MTHQPWCQQRTDRPPLDDNPRSKTPCCGPIDAEADGLAAWLVEGPAGTMVDIDHQAGQSIPVQKFADFCQQGLVMAVKGGAIPPVNP